jgi:hypothetical protein
MPQGRRRRGLEDQQRAVSEEKETMFAQNVCF